MNIQLQVGQQYYWLDPVEHAAVHEYLGNEGIACLFEEGPDGFFYLPMNMITEQVYDYLLYDADLLKTTVYSLSTQPGASQ